MKTYTEVLSWMYERLPMYQRQGKVAYRIGLDSIRDFMEYLHHPEQKINPIHIAGTNGKGSTAHMMASVLQEAGYRVGIYSSPHLVDFRERIKINGVFIPKRRSGGFYFAASKLFGSPQALFF